MEKLMNTPTQEQISRWVEDAYTSGKTQAEAIATFAYQAGRESLLKELRDGGVEIPMSIDYSDALAIEPIYAYHKEQLIDYGDRRAAAEWERCAVIAWNHYMDTCKKKGLPPAEFEHWIACDAIRGAKP